jgi:flagellar motor protein MotB
MIRVQQRMRGPATHTDDWLITYADMITLLLCFFVIFFVLLSSRKSGQEDPLAAQVVAPKAQDMHSTKLHETLTRAAQSESSISLSDAFEDSGNSLADEAAARIGLQSPARAANTSNSAPPVVLTEQDSRPTQGVDVESKTDRISLLEIASSAFFGSGSADLSESGRSILRDVADELKSTRYDGYEIVVEGHTDDTPIATAHFSSNWELSTARAAAVVHFFLDQGLPANRLRAAGYAETRPRVANRDADGNTIPENQALNRRVVIRLEKIETTP